MSLQVRAKMNFVLKISQKSKSIVFIHKNERNNLPRNSEGILKILSVGSGGRSSPQIISTKLDSLETNCRLP